MTDLPSIYRRARIMLWVEDLQTRQYLDAVWRTPDIGYLIGGSSDTIQAVTKDAYRAGYGHVFGLRDRDFGPSNRRRWSSMADDARVYALDALEIENLLLDPPAIAACRFNTAKRSSDEIEGALRAEAEGMVWWMATRSVIADLQRMGTHGFPKHPKRSAVHDERSAQAHILGSTWIERTIPDLPKAVDADAIRAALTQARAAYEADLGTGEWMRSFAGKELFAKLDSFVFTRGRVTGSQATLARAIAEQQFAVGRVPAMIIELRDALLSRVRRSA